MFSNSIKSFTQQKIDMDCEKPQVPKTEIKMPKEENVVVETEEPDALDALEALIFDEAMKEFEAEERQREIDELELLEHSKKLERMKLAQEFLEHAKANEELGYKQGFATYYDELDEEDSNSRPFCCRKDAPGVYAFIFPKQLMSKKKAYMGYVPAMKLEFSYVPRQDGVDITININSVQTRNPIVSITWV